MKFISSVQSVGSPFFKRKIFQPLVNARVCFIRYVMMNLVASSALKLLVKTTLCKMS